MYFLLVQIFYQVVVVLALYLDQVFPCSYILLPRKTRTIYERAFGALKEVMTGMGLSLQPRLVIITDFEQGLLQSLSATFPWVTQHGCFFHFAQAVHRHVGQMGFIPRYNNPNDDFRNSVKCFIALAFVPADWVVWYYQALLHHVSGDPDLVRFANDYFYNTWMILFPPILWNCFAMACRTNNHAEANNSAMVKPFPLFHPGVFKFLKLVREHHLSCMGDVNCRELGAPPPPRVLAYRKRDEAIRRAEGEFQVRDPISYLRLHAHMVPEMRRK
jgi:hypothetical protein